MKKRLLAGLLATSIALSISMGAFPAMAATNDDFVEDREDIADFTDDSYSSGYSSSEQLFDDIIFFDLDEEVDNTAAEVIAEEDANDSSDTEIDRAADSIEETEPEDEVQDTDAAEDRNDREDSDEETKSGTQNPEEAGPSDAETEEDVPDSWEETPKIDSELEQPSLPKIRSLIMTMMRQKKKWMTTLRCWLPEKPWRTKTTHTPMCRLVQSTWWTSTRTTRQNLEADHLLRRSECILPSTIYYTDADGVPEPTPYTVTELRLSYWSGVTSDNNNYTALVLPDTLTDIGGSLSGFKNVTEITIPGSVKFQCGSAKHERIEDSDLRGGRGGDCFGIGRIRLQELDNHPSAQQPAKTLRDGHLFRRIGADGYHAPGRHCDHRVPPSASVLL